MCAVLIREQAESVAFFADGANLPSNNSASHMCSYTSATDRVVFNCSDSEDESYSASRLTDDSQLQSLQNISTGDYPTSAELDGEKASTVDNSAEGHASHNGLTCVDNRSRCSTTISSPVSGTSLNQSVSFEDVSTVEKKGSTQLASSDLNLCTLGADIHQLSQECLDNASAVLVQHPVPSGGASPFSYPTVVLTPPSRSSGKSLTGWYYSLTASYKSKLEQFRRIFRGTPVDTDRLLVDYACALSKNNHGLLLQGRMYVTENWVCFYSKILYEQKIFLAVKEIIAITKEKTARVIPNAIQILYSKSRERFFFTSFSSRERTYAILRKVWENCRNHQVNQELSMSIDEIMQQVREIYGDDSLALLDDEDTDPDQDLIRRPYNSRSRHSSESSLSCQPNDPLKETLPSVSWPLNRTTDGDQPSKPSTRGTSEGDDDEEDGLRLDRLGSSQTLDHGPSLSDPSQSTLTVGRIAKSEISNTLVRSRRCRTPDVHSAVSIKTMNNEVALCEIHSASQLSFVTERKKRSKRRHARSVIPQDLDSEPVKQNWVEKNVNSTFGQHPGNDLDSPASCSDHDHPGRFYLDTETPLSVDALFSCIFTDSEFYDRLCSSRGTFNLVQSSWPSIVWPASGEKMEDTNLPSSVDRTISYTMPLKQRLGPRTCTSVERQTLLINESRPGERYVVDSEVNNQAVPLCSSFYVTIRYCLLRGSRFTSRLRVCSQVVYKKQVFFGAKSIIENTCRSGLTEYLTALTNLLIGEASRFNDDDRLTGGFLAKQSTSTSIVHNGPQAIRTADRDFKAKERTAANHVMSGETAGRDGPDSRGQPFRRDRLNQDGDFIPPQTAHKVHSSSPSHSTIPNESSYIPYCQNFPFKSITYFFLRPDRAWLLLVLISLLLCLCLSMVYNRVVALEKLAERLSVTSPDASFGSFGSADSPGLQPNLFPISQRKDEMTRTKLTAMKELAKAMSNTLTQMQQVLSTVSRSIDLLEKSYASGGTAVESFTGSASAQSSSLPSGPQMTFSDLTHPAS